MTKSTRKTWNRTDNSYLINHWTEVGSVVLIAMLMERTPSSVQTQASRLGLPRRSIGKEQHRRRWKDDETQSLKDAVENFKNKKFDIHKLAESHGRSVDAIIVKLSSIYKNPEDIKNIISKISIPKPSKIKVEKETPGKNDQQIRECITCSLPFWSDWIGNRICKKCCKLNQEYYD